MGQEESLEAPPENTYDEEEDDGSIINVTRGKNRKLICSLWYNLENDRLTDVHFILKDGKIVKAHRLILMSSASRVFRKMFEENHFRSYKEVFLPEVDYDGFYEVLRFLYMEETEFKDMKDIIHAYYVSEIFNIPTLQRAADASMQGCEIKTEEVLQLLTMAYQFNIRQLIRLLLILLSEETEEILDSRDFLTQNHSFIAALCCMSQLNIKSELFLFEKVVEWVRHQNPDGDIEQAMETFLPYIRFDTITEEEFRWIRKYYYYLFSPEDLVDIGNAIRAKDENGFSVFQQNKPRRAKIKDRRRIIFPERGTSHNYDIQVFNTPLKNNDITSQQANENSVLLPENFVCSFDIDVSLMPIKLYGLKLKWDEKNFYRGPVTVFHSVSIISLSNSAKVAETSEKFCRNKQGADIRFPIPILLKNGAFKVQTYLKYVRGIRFKIIDEDNFYNHRMSRSAPFTLMRYTPDTDGSFFISEILYKPYKSTTDKQMKQGGFYY